MPAFGLPQWLTPPLLLAILLMRVPTPVTAQVSVIGQFDKSPKLPVGASVSFSCQVVNKDPDFSARMLCPLAKVGSSCFENCNRICADPTLCTEEPRLLRIACTQTTSGLSQIYTYYLANVDSMYSGSWGCKHKTTESTPVQLNVYPDPVIQSVTFNASTVVESQTTVAACTAQATIGSLRFTWARSDSLTIPHADSLVNATTSQLVVDNARRTDEAVYVCTVENEVGSRAVRQVSLTVNYPPASVRLASSLTSPLQTGASITFTCQVDGGKPDPAKRYYRERPSQARVEITATVTLEPADNNAKFYCKAESVGIVGTEIWSSPMTFAVFFPPSGIDLLESPSGSVAAGGATKQFTCSSTSSSNPPSSALWYSVSPAGLPQQIADGRVTVTQTDGPNSGKQMQSRLDIAPDRSLNGYTYRCILQYDSREISRKDISLQVTFAPDGSDLQASPADGVLENTGLNLVCQTSSGNPKPQINWFRVLKDAGSPTENVTALAVSTIDSAEYSGTKVTSRLLVTQTARSNDGAAYTCSVFYNNAIMSAQTKSFTLRIFYPPNVSVAVSPESPREGQQVTLSCLPTGGNPNTSSGSFSYVWRYLNGSGVWSTLSSAQPSLVIRNAVSTDNGMYQCSVGSRGGSATNAANLTLIFAPTAWPGTQAAVSAVPGQTVLLSLRVSANPPPTGGTWYRLDAGGLLLTLDARLVQGYIVGNQTYTLLVPGVTALDYASYMCVVSNSVGARNFTFSINRPGPPVSPSTLQVGNTTAVSAQVRWRSEFNGGFEQTFTLQWRSIGSSVWSPTNQKTGLRDPGFAQTVQESITALVSESTYYVRVRAENYYNGATTVSAFTDEVSLTTRKMPVIPDASLAALLTSGMVEIQFTPPLSVYYTSVYVKLCTTDCVLRQILDSEVRSGRATVLLPDPDASFRFSLVVRDGDVTVYETKTFEARAATATQTSTTAAGLSFEIVLGISIGSAVVVAVLLAAVIVTAILQCRNAGNADKSIRSTNSSDVTNGSGSPAGACGQPVQLAYRSSVSSAPPDGYYCPPPPPPVPLMMHPDGYGGGFSPGSRLSGQEVPLFSYYHAQAYQQHQQMMLSSAASRHRLNGTSSGSLNSQGLNQHYHQQHQQHLQQRILTPDLVQTETAIGGPTELVRYNSRVSLASSRSGVSGAPAAAPSAGPHPLVPSPGPLQSSSAVPTSAGGMGDQPYIFPNGSRGFSSPFDCPARFVVSPDSGFMSLALQPTYVATPLSPHMESNMEAIENYV